MEISDVIDRIIAVMDDKKGEDIRVYDVQKTSSLTEYVIIVGVSNSIHCKSMVQSVDDDMSIFLKTHPSDDFFDHPKVSGSVDGGWIVLDLNSIVVHIMTDEMRQFYTLDEVFSSKGVAYYS